MDSKFRCDCPFTCALDVVGDKWMLVIVKLMLIEGKQTFTDFVESDEAIATNILSTKLKQLEEWGLVIKTRPPDNKKTWWYRLTEKGLALAPVIAELGRWSDAYVRPQRPTMSNGPEMAVLRADPEAFVDNVETHYRAHYSEGLEA